MGTPFQFAHAHLYSLGRPQHVGIDARVGEFGYGIIARQVAEYLSLWVDILLCIAILVVSAA